MREILKQLRTAEDDLKVRLWRLSRARDFNLRLVEPTARAEATTAIHSAINARAEAERALEAIDDLEPILEMIASQCA